MARVGLAWGLGTRKGNVPRVAAGGALPHVLTLQRLAHASDGLERELEHERCLEPQHPIAEPR